MVHPASPLPFWTQRLSESGIPLFHSERRWWMSVQLLLEGYSLALGLFLLAIEWLLRLCCGWCCCRRTVHPAPGGRDSSDDEAFRTPPRRSSLIVVVWSCCLMGSISLSEAWLVGLPGDAAKDDGTGFGRDVLHPADPERLAQCDWCATGCTAGRRQRTVIDVIVGCREGEHRGEFRVAGRAR